MKKNEKIFKKDKRESGEDNLQENKENEIVFSDKEKRKQFLLNLQETLAKEGISRIGDIEVKLRKLELE